MDCIIQMGQSSSLGDARVGVVAIFSPGIDGSERQGRNSKGRCCSCHHSQQPRTGPKSLGLVVALWLSGEPLQQLVGKENWKGMTLLLVLDDEPDILFQVFNICS